MSGGEHTWEKSSEEALNGQYDILIGETEETRYTNTLDTDEDGRCHMVILLDGRAGVGTEWQEDVMQTK